MTGVARSVPNGYPSPAAFTANVNQEVNQVFSELGPAIMGQGEYLLGSTVGVASSIIFGTTFSQSDNLFLQSSPVRAFRSPTYLHVHESAFL
jgi:hypothetical protein